MASTKISRTPSGAGNRNKWTISLWLKRAKIGVEQVIASCYGDSNNQTQIKFESDDQLYFNDENSGNTNGRIVSNAKYRDTNAWYHMVFIWDKDNSTSDDKLRMYVNGERITSFSDTGNAPSALSEWNSTTAQQFGAKSSSDYFDGIMSHIHFCDGYAYEPTEFGETDSTTGEWKIKTSPSVSYGTNGYFWLKDDVATTDHSPNSNTFTASGTLTKTEDNPSNVFATFNPLNVPTSDKPTFAAGNTDLDSCGNAGLFHGSSTLGMSSGKFYAEFKWKSNNYAVAGVSSRARNDARENKRPGAESGSYGFELYNGGVKVNNSTLGGFSGSSLSIGDILCIAIDCDNNKLYFRKNGDAWMNSGDPTSGSTGTGAVSLTAATGGDYDGFWFFVIGDGDTSSSSKISANFGNGYFLTTAVSSAGTNASGLGIFEYDVPAGYTALSTKGLNE